MDSLYFFHPPSHLLELESYPQNPTRHVYKRDESTLDLIVKNSWSTHCHQTSSCQNAPLCVVDAREITTWLKLLGLKLVIRDFHTATAASRCGGTVATAISGSATIAGVKRVKSMILEFPGDWTRLFYSWFTSNQIVLLNFQSRQARNKGTCYNCNRW